MSDGKPSKNVRSKKRKCVLIFGMHRSGTSMMTRCINLLGVAAAKYSIAGDEHNQSGYWEPKLLNDLNTQLLQEAGSSWDDWRAFDIDVLSSERQQYYRAQIKDAIEREFGDAEFFVLKEPRISRMVSIYKDVLSDMGIEPSFVLMNRNPIATVGSLNKRDGMSKTYASLLWLRNQLEAEKATRGEKRAFVRYETMMSGPDVALRQVQKSLGLKWPISVTKASVEITKFIDPSLQHHHAGWSEIEASDFVPDLVKDAYRVLHDHTSGDDQPISSVFDAIRQQMEAGDQLFGDAAFEEIFRYKAINTGLDQKLGDERTAHLVIQEDLHHQIAAQEAAHAILKNDIEAAQHIAGQQKHNIEQLEDVNAALNGTIEEIFSSSSWRLTKPIRWIGAQMADQDNAVGRFRKYASDGSRAMWELLPVTPSGKKAIKGAVFSALPFLFRRTVAFQNWKLQRSAQRHGLLVGKKSGHDDKLDFGFKSDQAISKVSTQAIAGASSFEPPLNAPARLICFYLPQFHAIPENDEWWGEGFTEWTNVRPAQPQFEDHYQPRIPAELGYYDLLDGKTIASQVALAKDYGIEGFCFYFYWFAGKRLLEKPVENYLADRSLDLPFCLCWANENWSRRWDGLEADILMAQDYSPEDDLAFIRETGPYLKDPRYIRIDGKPLLLVYRPSLLPSAKDTAQRWRKWCRENGIGEIHLAYVQSFEATDPDLYGFDAAVEFPPNNSAPPDATDSVTPLHDDFGSKIFDWSVLPERSFQYSEMEYPLYRGVCPSWDNTARRKNNSTVFINNTPEKFQRWVQNALADTNRRFARPDEKLVFVNAWNEWAEGAYLEPDAQNGHSYLNATRNALVAMEGTSTRSILVVTHDCHSHGAQFLALSMVRCLKEMGYRTYVLSLGDGSLLDDFIDVADCVFVGDGEGADTFEYLERLKRQGVRDVIANSIVSGSVLPTLNSLGFKVVSLVHEMPGVYKQLGLKKAAKNVAKYSEKIVFPAHLVADGFKNAHAFDLDKEYIRPQGLLKKNRFKHRRKDASNLIRERHGLNADAKIILNIAYVDRRKAPDYFVKMAAKVLAKEPNSVFIWIGHAYQPSLDEAVEIAAQLEISDSVMFLPFTQDLMPYYAAADVYALTSREDPFPNVVIDAIDVGTPVVAFKEATGAAEYIESHGGQCARLGDVDAFAGSVLALLRNEAANQLPSDNSLRQYILDILHHLNGLQRVSVVVPNYNYAHHMKARLETVFNQDFPLYEVIVLDDQSSDDSVGVLQTVLEQYGHIDSRLIVNSENSGSVFRQWKKGFELCGGDLVWIAEADDLSAPDFVSALASGFDDESVAIAFCQSQQMDGDGDILAPDYLEYTGSISDIWEHDYLREGKTEIAEAMYIKNIIPNVSAVVFRKDALSNAFDRLGERLFDFKIAGDWMVYLQILTGGKIFYRSKALNFHRRHQASVTQSEKKEMHLDEVASAQKKAQQLVKIPKHAIKRAETYLKEVSRYLGV